MSLSCLRPFQIISLVIMVSCYLVLTFSFGRWLNPAPSDIRLSFEQTSPAENSILPQRALDNNMPQLGKFPYWVDGKLMQAFGRFSPYATRYSLFLISLGLMFFLFIRFIKPPEGSVTEWSLIFLLTLSGSFFFSIKFFFWLDYLVAIPLTLALIILMRKSIPAFVIFVLAMLILYVKISAVFILLIFFGVFASVDLVKKYRVPLLSASLISIVFFFMKSGFAPLADRGHSIFNNFSGYSLMGLNFIASPWNMIGIFDKSIQKLVTEINPMMVIKLGLFLTTIGWLIWKKTPGAKFRMSCIFLGFASSLILLRDTPTLHDFSVYNGVVELGCLSLFWILYREAETKMRAGIIGTFLIIATTQFGLWNSAISDVKAGVPKAALTGKILDIAGGENHNLFLFCSGNVGEFEYFLNGVYIHYLLWEDPYPKEIVLNSRPAIFLVPKRCQHEEVTPLMKRKYSAIISETGARYLETVQIDRNQIYEIYEAR